MITPRCLWASTLILFALGSANAQTATSRIVSTANAFLSTLDEKQRQSVLFAFDDDEQRARWSNFPISIVPRAGLAMKDMPPAQRAAAMNLLGAALSKRGLEKVQRIMEGDEVLKTNEANGRGGGGPPPGPATGSRCVKATVLPEADRRPAAAVQAAALCSARTSIISPFWESRPKKLLGRCSSADITLR